MSNDKLLVSFAAAEIGKNMLIFTQLACCNTGGTLIIIIIRQLRTRQLIQIT
jgi:hypothetical protein